MNERIKQLKKQATDFYLLDETLDCSVTELHQLVEEKFAELIIKETLQVARAGVEFGPSMEDAVYNYFGVE